MSFKKTLEPDNKSITSFQVHKTFSFTEADSGSGVYSIPLIKGTDANLQNFSTTTATSTTISGNVFFRVPTWHTINNLYYRDIKQMRGYIDFIRGVPTSSDAVSEYTYTRPLSYNSETGNRNTYKLRRPHTRQLHDTANVISIPQELYGEYIEPHSFRLTDDSTNSTFILEDDGRGNIYDVAFTSSYSSRTPNSNNSGSLVGNIFYNDGLVVITDTGSYSSVGTGNGSDGFTLKFNSTQTIYEREYVCIADENEFQDTTNKSLKVGFSGSVTIPTLPTTPYTNTVKDRYPYTLVGFSTSSYDLNGYNMGTELIGEATHSDFSTYITTIGLYNDENELLAIGKTASPIKNEKDIALTFVVRFDTN